MNDDIPGCCNFLFLGDEGSSSLIVVSELVFVKYFHTSDFFDIYKIGLIFLSLKKVSNQLCR